MPPKKKDKGKGKDAKGSAKSPPNLTELPTPKLSEASKEFYLIQIKDLEQRLHRYQKRCDELEIANGNFLEKFEQLDTDKKEIIELLKRQEKQKSDEIIDLTDRLHGLHQSKQTEKEQYETQVHNLRNELEQVREQLTSENMILSGKLSSLEEFRMQKEDLMTRFAAMEVTLQEMETEHKQSLYELEKKQIIDKDRMKKDMFVRVDQLVSEFRKVSDKQMAETTKRTIRENVSITAQMSKMSDKTVELIDENDELKGKEKKLMNKLKILEHNEKELTKKNLSGQKLINMLTEKCHELEDQLSVYRQRGLEFEEKIQESESLQGLIANYKEENERYKNSLDDLQEQYTNALGEASKIKTHHNKVVDVLVEASDAIRDALSNMSKYGKEEDSFSIQVSQRETMLQHLLWILNSTAVMGYGPAASELGKPQKEKTTPEQLKKLLLPPIASGTSAAKEVSLAHYNIGDLGFVPRSTQQIPTSLEKMRSLIPQPQSARKVSTRSIGVQTISATKALFFAEKLMSQNASPGRKPLIDMGEFHRIETRSLSTLATTPAISLKSSCSIRNKAS